MHDCTTLNDYLTRYGCLLGEQAQKSLRPLHVPGTDPLVEGIEDLLRQPYQPQAEVITAVVKALRRQKSVFLIAECGTGKTLMGMAAAHLHAAGRPYRALVLCPGQLLKKWEREIRETIPGVAVTQIESCWDLPALIKAPKPAGPEWYVIGRDRAKLGAKWRAAVVQRNGVLRSDGGKTYFQSLHCPACGERVTERSKSGDAGTAVPLEKLQRLKHTCEGCGQSLWQYTSELHRFEPARFIHRKLPGFFRYLICDELHEGKSSSSAQANALGSLAAAATKVIGMTGTLIGGYAEHIRPLLWRLSPGTLVEEGLRWKDVTPFVERYGRVETVITETNSAGSDNANPGAGSLESWTWSRTIPPRAWIAFQDHGKDLRDIINEKLDACR